MVCRLFRSCLYLCLPLVLAACSDGVFVISFNSGMIVGDPRCHGSGGEFDLSGTGGLVLVIITDGTEILIAGGFGTCTDLSAGTRVDVEGQQRGDEIVATSITVE
jgi:hypothetical protein